MIWIVVAVLVVGIGAGVAQTLRFVHWEPPWRRTAPEAEIPIDEREIVTITGKVRLAGTPLITPLSARRCVFYEAYANLYDGSEPRTLLGQLARREMTPFELVTPLGIIAIEGTEADVELVPVPVLPRRPEREALFLREHDRDDRLVDTSTFEEVSIDPDSLVSVTGRAIVKGSQIRIVPPDDRPLVIGLPRRTTLT
jgi:hypothetical protein